MAYNPEISKAAQRRLAGYTDPYGDSLDIASMLENERKNPLLTPEDMKAAATFAGEAKIIKGYSELCASGCRIEGSLNGSPEAEGNRPYFMTSGLGGRALASDGDHGEPKTNEEDEAVKESWMARVYDSDGQTTETQEYEGQTEAWFKDTKDLVIAIDDMERGAQLEGLLTAGMMSQKKKDLRKLTEAGQTAEEETSAADERREAIFAERARESGEDTTTPPLCPEDLLSLYVLGRSFLAPEETFRFHGKLANSRVSIGDMAPSGSQSTPALAYAYARMKALVDTMQDIQMGIPAESDTPFYTPRIRRTAMTFIPLAAPSTAEERAEDLDKSLEYLEMPADKASEMTTRIHWELGATIQGDPTPYHFQRTYLSQLVAAGSGVDFANATDEAKRPFELAAALLHRNILLDSDKRDSSAASNLKAIRADLETWQKQHNPREPDVLRHGEKFRKAISDLVSVHQRMEKKDQIEFVKAIRRCSSKKQGQLKGRVLTPEQASWYWLLTVDPDQSSKSLTSRMSSLFK